MRTFRGKAFKNISRRQGFTLVEMAAVVVLFGLVLTGFARVYTMYLDSKRIETTEVHVTAAKTAISQYRAINGAFPCPASLTDVRGDLNYGRQTDCEDTAVAPGNCAGGICIEQSLRTVDPGGGPIQPRVRIGMLPFRSLNLHEEDAYDGYDNRLMYIVTERLAVPDTFHADHGGIEINDPAGNTILTPAASAHFLLFSYGANQAGAWDKAGLQIPCPISGIEVENCDAEVDAVYVDTQTSTAGGDDNFDDVLDYATEDEAPLWQVSEIDALDIHHKPDGKVGFMVSAGQNLEEQGHISGAIRAQDDPQTTTVQEGRILIDNLCTFGGEDCFPTSKISGFLASGGGIQCASGFVQQVSNGDFVCIDEVVLTCPDNTWVTGINPDGSLDCDVPPPDDCLADSADLCGSPQGLPASPHGSQYTITAGDCKEQTFECDDGFWESQGTTGQCSFTPETTQETFQCPLGETGTYTTEVTTLCEGGTTDPIIIEDLCVCDPILDTWTENCDPGYSGNELWGRQKFCDPDYWGPDTLIEDNCVCDPNDTDTRTIPCTGGKVGPGIYQENYFTCPPPAWSGWTTISEDCTCPAPQVEQRQNSCPPGETGYIVEERTLTSCDPATYTPWTEIENYCEPQPPVTCNWNNQGSGVQNEPFGVGNEKGEVCVDPDDCGTQGPCHIKYSPSNYTNFYGNSCICE